MIKNINDIEMTDIKVGTRIYYGGDMANPDGFGTVSDVGRNSFTAKWYSIDMDDGTFISMLPACMFSKKYAGNGSTRFVTKDAYDAWRAEALADMKARAEVVEAKIAAKKESAA
jgi:hypothetical protein|tara:strand:- start:245 stop:586 length:342 start_codon:yes stop_codon:yes gene_type:complete